MKKLAAFLLLLSMVASFTGCGGEDEIMLLNSNEVKGVAFIRSWIVSGELPHELSDDEIPLFIEKLNALQLRSEKNYRLNDEDILTGGVFSLNIRLIDDTVLTFSRIPINEITGFSVGGSESKKNYTRYENVGIVTADSETLLDFLKYAESVSGYYGISGYFDDILY